jgi:anti-sigma factor RsiW
VSMRRTRPQHHDVTCERAVGLVTAYLEGVLSLADSDRFEQHLAECPHCREHLKQIEAAILVTGEIRADDLDPLAREDLMDLYRHWRDEASRP